MWPAAVLIVLFFVAAFSEARLKSPTSDEPPHIAAGLSYFVSHEIFRANPQHPPLLKEMAALSLMAAGVRWPNTPDANYLIKGDDPMRIFGLAWPIGDQLIWQNGPDRTLLWARLPMILTGALLGVVVLLWTRQLFGAIAAAGAVLVFALDPTVLAHTQFVTTDVGAATFALLTLFAVWNYMRRPTKLRLALSGLALGAALTAKFSNLFLLPILGLLMLAALRWPMETAKRPTVRSLAIALAAMGATAFVFVQATYFFPGDLMMYEKCARMVNADHNPDYVMFLAGETRHHFPTYFLYAYLLKEPIAAIVLAGVGLVALARTRQVAMLTKLFLLVPPAVFFLSVSAMADNLGVRYLIPTLAFTYVLAGLGVATLIQAGGKARWAAAGLCAWLAIAAVGIYPDHLSYFNEAACVLTEPSRIGFDGGTRCGTEWLEDSNVDWGQGFKQLKWWLDRNAPGQRIKLAYTTSFAPEAYGINCEHLQMVDLAKEPEPGLYVVSAHLVARTPALTRAADWLRFTKPVAIVGHALYVYDIRR